MTVKCYQCDREINLAGVGPARVYDEDHGKWFLTGQTADVTKMKFLCGLCDISLEAAAGKAGIDPFEVSIKWWEKKDEALVKPI